MEGMSSGHNCVELIKELSLKLIKDVKTCKSSPKSTSQPKIFKFINRMFLQFPMKCSEILFQSLSSWKGGGGNKLEFQSLRLFESLHAT